MTPRLAILASLVCLLLLSLAFAEPPKVPAPAPAIAPKAVPPIPAWVTNAVDAKSPARPFARGIFSTQAAQLEKFVPSGALAKELKAPAGYVLRVYDGNLEAKPAVPASMEVLKDGARLFAARGHRFQNATAEDITGDNAPDVFRITHISGTEPTSFHQFIVELGVAFRVQTIGPFANPIPNPKSDKSGPPQP